MPGCSLHEATGSDRQPDPVFYPAGGPGQGAASIARAHAQSWMRRKRDIVLVGQRDTGRSNPLPVRMNGGDNDLQSYLEPVFRAALPELERRADLTVHHSDRIVVPAAHGVDIPRVTRLQSEFLDCANVEDLDTSFVSDLRPPKLHLPK